MNEIKDENGKNPRVSATAVLEKHKTTTLKIGLILEKMIALIGTNLPLRATTISAVKKLIKELKTLWLVSILEITGGRMTKETKMLGRSSRTASLAKFLEKEYGDNVKKVTSKAENEEITYVITIKDKE